jgi:hypothetical protein
MLTLVAARGLSLSSEVRERILSCTDLATLDRWIARAAVAESVAELFDRDDVES